MRISIQYSLEFEIQRVVETLRERSWLRDKGYFFQLPIALEHVSGDVDVKAIQDAVRGEYDPSVYSNLEEEIKRQWGAVEGQLNQGAVAMALPLEKGYGVYLTQYGTRGSYKPPRDVIINISGRSPETIVRTLAHEIIHLLIDPILREYPVEHWQKERLVDLIGDRILSGVARLQKIAIDTAEVDTAVAELFPDISAIIKKLSS